MEIEITSLIGPKAPNMRLFSASQAETGNPDVGRATWNAARERATQAPLLKTHEECDAAREYFAEFGAWSDAELAAMPDAEINALTLQYVAGSIRDMERFDSFRAYSRAAKAGRCGSGEVYKVGRRYYMDLQH